MISYDVLLIHPPAIYDFRKKIIFSNPVSYISGESTNQFIIPSIGIFSIADYLDRNGYKVLIENLAERMITNNTFNVEEYIQSIQAKIYAIGLHWSIHSQGAIEIARLCKKFHPDSIVILGGLTATRFHQEIIEKYEFIDAVIKGEAEKPFISLAKTLEAKKNLKEVPNLTFRNEEGKIISNPMIMPVASLDEFEFTRLDLIEPRGTIFTKDVPSHWTIPICRGCLYNCVTCGGSAYSYKTHLCREKPSFRSPGKISEDILKLNQQGIKTVSLCQDPRMGGQKYCNELFTSLRNILLKNDIKINKLVFDICGPADEEYIKELSRIGVPLVLKMSVESGVDKVRIAHGLNFTNDELFKTINNCIKYDIGLVIFSTIALSNDTLETLQRTWRLWEHICKLNAQYKSNIHYSFGPIIFLDPGSFAFDFPMNNGYILKFKNLEDYINGINQPLWNQWISYETKILNRNLITKYIIDSIEYSINLRENYGLYSKFDADEFRRTVVYASREIIKRANSILNLCME